MLVLERKAEEKILIGDSIVITIIKFKHQKGDHAVKIGIEAPKSIRVLRDDAKNKEPKSD